MTKHKKVYKLTTQEGTTYNGYRWSLPVGKRPGKFHSTSGQGGLCGPGFLHFYYHPLLAALLNPIHANIKNPILWEAEARHGEVMLDDRGLKGGCSGLRLVREVRMPTPTATQRAAFDILCAMKVRTNKEWQMCATRWIDGVDRKSSAAMAVARDAEGAPTRAAEISKPLDLISLAQKAMKVKKQQRS